MAEAKPTKIGDMNGWTPMLLKFHLVLMPVVVVLLFGLGTWLVRSQNETARMQAVILEKIEHFAAGYYNRDSARADSLQLRMSILSEIAEKYPPRHLMQHVEQLDNRIKRLEDVNP